MTQEEFDKAPLLDQILYDTTGMLVENHKSIAEAMEKYHQAKLKLLGIDDVVSRFSGDNLIKLQKRFVGLYGGDEMAQEKANSFAVGFGKACELMCKELQNGL